MGIAEIASWSPTMPSRSASLGGRTISPPPPAAPTRSLARRVFLAHEA